jgi:hypothetical protein
MVKKNTYNKMNIWLRGIGIPPSGEFNRKKEWISDGQDLIEVRDKKFATNIITLTYSL